MLTKTQICEALRKWIRQRPGLDFANYGGDGSAYCSEQRSIARTGRDAMTLLNAVAGRDAITAEQLTDAFRAYSGRLTLKEVDGKAELDYCTGQYWPTEYRAAAAAVCAAALWEYLRSNMPEPTGAKLTRKLGPFETEHDNINGLTPGDWLRREARIMFGASIQKRWFS